MLFTNDNAHYQQPCWQIDQSVPEKSKVNQGLIEFLIFFSRGISFQFDRSKVDQTLNFLPWHQLQVRSIELPEPNFQTSTDGPF